MFTATWMWAACFSCRSSLRLFLSVGWLNRERWPVQSSCWTPAFACGWCCPSSSSPSSSASSVTMWRSCSTAIRRSTWSRCLTGELSVTSCVCVELTVWALPVFSVTMTLFLWYIDRNSEEKAPSQIHVNFIYHVFLARCRTFTVWVYGGADSLCTVAVKARFHMILHSRSKSLRAATLAS